MLRCRSSKSNISLQRGPKRGGSSKGYRVRINISGATTGYSRGNDFYLSVYPEDARKFALELLQMADECEKS